MIGMLKIVAVWLICTLSAFLIVFVIGSFCSLSLDITSWTNPGGRFAIAFCTAIVGVMGVCGYLDHSETLSMTKEERDKKLARRAQEERDFHADY